MRIPDEEPAQNRPILRRSLDNEPKFVKTLQTALGIATADGIFGPFIEAAIRKFQLSCGTVPDEIVGPKTWAAIDKSWKDQTSLASSITSEPGRSN